MRKLLFEINLSGHRLEYVHHLYVGMAACPQDQLILVLPISFKLKCSIYDWPKLHNVQFVFLRDEELLPLQKKTSTLNLALKKTLLLRNYVKQLYPDSVFLITLMEFIPFLPLLLPRDVKVSGIVYAIYLYRWKSSSLITKLTDILKYNVIRHGNCISTVFILNDAPAARLLNRLYHTDKFCYLTDPFNFINYTPKDIRNKLNISPSKRIFLQFGGLSGRKGTLLVLEAVKHMSLRKRTHICLVFAGIVNDDIKNEFYKIITELQETVDIRVFDEFCSNELLADLCFSCDVILVPYKNTAQSSGLIGHAAYYSKPVIGPSDGLLGKIIRRHKLGATIVNMTPESLADAMQSILTFKQSNSYKDSVCADDFVSKIYERF